MGKDLIKNSETYWFLELINNVFWENESHYVSTMYCWYPFNSLICAIILV